MRKLSGATPVFVTMQWFSTYGSLAGPVWIACDNVNVKLACAEPQHSTPKKTALPRLQWRRVAFMMSHFMTVSFLAAVCAGRCGSYRETSPPSRSGLTVGSIGGWARTALDTRELEARWRRRRSVAQVPR